MCTCIAPSPYQDREHSHHPQKVSLCTFPVNPHPIDYFLFHHRLVLPVLEMESDGSLVWGFFHSVQSLRFIHAVTKQLPIPLYCWIKMPIEGIHHIGLSILLLVDLRNLRNCDKQAQQPRKLHKPLGEKSQTEFAPRLLRNQQGDRQAGVLLWRMETCVRLILSAKHHDLLGKPWHPLLLATGKLVTAANMSSSAMKGWCRNQTGLNANKTPPKDLRTKAVI